MENLMIQHYVIIMMFADEAALPGAEEG